MTPSARLRIVMIDSIAPAAPRVWPSDAFGAVTTTWAPTAAVIDAVSAASPTGVEVAWALTWPTSSPLAPARRRAVVIARAWPSPFSGEAVMW